MSARLDAGATGEPIEHAAATLIVHFLQSQNLVAETDQRIDFHLGNSAWPNNVCPMLHKSEG
jgi:hypothetical protein